MSDGGHQVTVTKRQKATWGGWVRGGALGKTQGPDAARPCPPGTRRDPKEASQWLDAFGARREAEVRGATGRERLSQGGGGGHDETALMVVCAEALILQRLSTTLG